MRFKKVSARSTALRSALPLLFFSPELTSRDVNVLQRSAEETLIVRRVLVGDATLFCKRARAGSKFVWAVFAKRRAFKFCFGGKKKVR